MTGCPKTVPNPKLPEGMSVDTMRQHPTWGYWVDGRPGGGCCLELGHQGPHATGPAGTARIVWHDPPVVIHEADLAR